MKRKKLKQLENAERQMQAAVKDAHDAVVRIKAIKEAEEADKPTAFRYANLDVVMKLYSEKRILAAFGISKQGLNELLSGYGRPSWALANVIRNVAGIPLFDLLLMNQKTNKPNERK